MIYRTVLAAGILFCHQANAAISTEENWTYYRVSGNTAVELRQSINSNRRNRQQRFDAKTQWQIRWQFHFAPARQRCEITDVQIDAKIDYLLPEWPESGSHPNKQLTRSWTRYIEQLRAHEQQHGDLVKSAMLTIERAILQASTLDSAPRSCRKLETLANQRANDVVKLLEQRQLQFDLVTSHGRKTGATFP